MGRVTPIKKQKNLDFCDRKQNILHPLAIALIGYRLLELLSSLT